MKILFICKHNRFRSQVAECIFNTLNKNPENKAESAGMILDKTLPKIEKNVIKIMKEKGYALKGKFRQARQGLIDNYDLTIIVADNVNPKKFKKSKKVKQWKIKDCACSDKISIRKIINQIEKKIKKLLNKL